MALTTVLPYALTCYTVISGHAVGAVGIGHIPGVRGGAPVGGRPGCITAPADAAAAAGAATGAPPGGCVSD